MRILTYFRETNYGGVHTYLLSQIDYLIKQGHEVWVSFSRETTCETFKSLGAKTFCNKELIRSIRLHKDLYALWRVYRFCKLNSIDCIFAHTSKGGIVGVLGGFLANTPIRVRVFHGFSFTEYTSYYRRIVYTFLERFAAYFATDLITVNNKDRDILIKTKICKPKKIHTVLNGVIIPDDKILMSENEKKTFLINEGFDHKDRIILFVGRFMKPKTPMYLINAFCDVNCPNARLVFIGEGPLKTDCQNLTKKQKIDKRVSFLGFRKDVAKWYQICSVYVLPSHGEGLPMTLLEAMSYGACCIATNVKGNRECIEDERDGVLVSPNMPSELASTITRILKDEHLRKRLGKAARKKIMQNFSAQRMCDQTNKIICSYNEAEEKK
jgi:glycosyltransferase involved in cell wall biosynthesis